MDQLKQALKVAHASTVAFYMKAHNFHFNVEGPLFLQFHQLFEIIYSEVYGSIDTFAEQLRALQMYTPASLQKFSMLTKVEDENEVNNRESYDGASNIGDDKAN